MSDELAKRIADALELAVHDLRTNGVSALPQQAVGVYDRGIMRLNLDDVGRIAARVIEGSYDADEVRAKNADHRAEKQGVGNREGSRTS